MRDECMDIQKYKVDNSVYELRDSIQLKYDTLNTLSQEIGKYAVPIFKTQTKL